MVTPGIKHANPGTLADIAWATVRTFSRTIPPAIPGVVFLSGGHSEDKTTEMLNAINQVTGVIKPWSLSFSFGRALQKSAQIAWLGIIIIE